MKNSHHRSEMIRGWSGSADIFGSVLAGLLIGLFLDSWLNTSPAFVVGLVVVAAVGAFYKSYADSERLEELAKEAVRVRDGI